VRQRRDPNARRATVLGQNPKPNAADHGDFIDSNPMEKDRDLRYQHTSEMKTDLMRVKRDSRFGRVEQAECRRGDR